jgi:pimeloyl-ACP methyl ester carboxylesterase
MVDTLVLGASAARHGGSSPLSRTILRRSFHELWRMVHHVIYIPGLGSPNPRWQRWLVSTWRLWGIRPETFLIKWGDGEAFQPKLERLLRRIDELHAKGHEVSLVAASAGAGAAINAFAQRKDIVSGVVCIAGKVNSPGAIGDSYRSSNPDFIESADQVQFSLDKLDFDTDRPRIMSRYAMFDPVVPKAHSLVAGGKNVMVWTSGHSITIATQLLFGAPVFIRFLKNI